MIRKFECQQCHHCFEADDHDMVVCPQCQSDHVDYARSHTAKKVWKWGAALLVLAAIMGGIYWGLGRDGKDDASEDRMGDNRTDVMVDDSLEGDTISIPIEDIKDLTTPPKVDIVGGKPKFVDGGYNFQAKVVHAPSSPYHVVVLDREDHSREIARADDKHFFKNVPPSTNKGMYDLGVKDAATDTLLGWSERSGFIVQETVATKMTEKELQTLIDNQDESLMSSTSNKQISPDCQFHCSGLPEGVTQPRSFKDIFMGLGGQWSAVSVTSVDYDSMNRISSVRLTITPK